MVYELVDNSTESHFISWRARSLARACRAGRAGLEFFPGFGFGFSVVFLNDL